MYHPHFGQKCSSIRTIPMITLYRWIENQFKQWEQLQNSISL